MKALNIWNLLENKLQINTPQSTQRAQSSVIPVEKYEKESESSPRSIFHYIPAIKEKRWKLMVDMRRVPDELEYAFDVIILTREEYERDSKIPGTVGRYASKEGKVIYEHS